MVPRPTTKEPVSQDNTIVLQRGAPKLLSNNASRGPIPDGAAEGPTDAEGMLVGEVDGE